MTDYASRRLVEARCWRKGHQLLTLVAASDGQLKVEIRHHPISVLGASHREGRVDLVVVAESEDGDPNGGPPITRDFDVDSLYAANCQCAQHTITGRHLYEAFRSRKRRILSDQVW